MEEGHHSDAHVRAAEALGRLTEVVVAHSSGDELALVLSHRVRGLDIFEHGLVVFLLYLGD